MTEENKNTPPSETQQIPAQPAQPLQPAQPSQADFRQQHTQHMAGDYGYQPHHDFAKQDPAPAKKRAVEKTGSTGKTFLAGFAGAALAVVLGLGGFIGYSAATGDDDGGTTLGGSGAVINASDTDPTLAESVASKVLPSIVSIDVYQSQSSDALSSLGFEAPGTDSDESLSQYSLGSGVVISEDGYIITNNHVVSGGDVLKATINGVEYDAELVGADASSDIAVIKVDANDLTAVEIGSSSDLKVGEWVMALGSPFGLENSVSEGIVSALQRSTTMADETSGETVVYPNMIQTDATINPGNSGGALVDAQGKLIGINSMIQSYSGSSSGVGFAIPVDYAMDLAQQIIDGKTPTHAQLGISMVQITDQMAEYYQLPTNTGVYVANVYEGTAAAEAGIQKGDIIVSFDGVEVTSPDELTLDVRGKEPGDKVEMTVNRNGKEIDLTVTLGSDETALESEEGEENPYGYGFEDSYGSEGSGSSDLFGYGF